MSQAPLARRLTTLIGLLLLTTCSDPNGGRVGVVAGYATYGTGPLVGAHVAVRQFFMAGETDLAGETVTDANGRFEVEVGDYFQQLTVIVTGGQAHDATGATLALDPTDELRAIILDQPGAGRSEIVISPLSDLGYRLGLARHAAGQDETDVLSMRAAMQHLNSHIGADVVAVSPAPVGQASAFDEHGKYAVALAAYEQLAVIAARDLGVTRAAVNIRLLQDQLVRDASSAEARLDGNGAEVLSVGPSCPLPSGCTAEGPSCYASCSVQTSTLRGRIAAAALEWLGTPENHLGLGASDILTWATTLTGNTDDQLFGPEAPEALDELGPEIAWATPGAGQVFTSGSIAIDVTATDPLGVATLGVDHVVGQTRTPIADTDPMPGHFVGALPLTPGLAEGPLQFEARATDRDGNASTAPRAVEINQLTGGAISGVAIKAALALAPVTVHAFTGGAPGAIIATGMTDAAGNFINLAIPEGTSGDLLLEVGGAGSYAEDAVPATVVSLGATDKLAVVIPGFVDGDAVSGLVVSPATTLAVSYLNYLLSANQGGTDLAAKWATATGALERHIGVTGIASVVPSVPSQVDSLDDADRYGLVLLGLSRTAWGASAIGGGDAGAFGSAVNAMKVLQVWVRDIGDGCWDGKAGPATLTYGGTTPLTDEATRLHLAQAVVAYLGSAQNQTQFAAAADVLPLLDTLATGGGNTAPGACAGTNHLFDDAGQGFDREGPVVTWGAFPATDPYVRGMVTVTASAVDNLPTLPSLLFTTGQTDIDVAPNAVRAVIDTSGMNGPVPLAVHAADGSMNSTDVAHDLIADNLAPAITISAPAMDGLFLRPPVTLGWSVVEANPMSTTATLDGATPVTPGFQVAAEGAHALSVMATDRAGGTGSATRAFTIDNTAPVLSVTAPASGSYVHGPVTLAWTVSDANPGTVAMATLDGNSIVSGASLTTEGTYTLVVNATDAAGNVAATVTRTFTVDNTPPVITVTAISGFVRGPITLTFSATDNYPPTTVTASLDTIAFSSGGQVNTEGAHTLVVNAVDQAGNPAVTVTRTFTVDNTGPVITSVVNPTGSIVQTPMTITATATDNFMASGSLPTNLAVTGMPAPTSTTPGSTGGNRTLAALYTAPADGPLTARFNITDAAGNAATEHVVTRMVDNTDPVPTITGVTAGAWYAAAVTIAFGQTDANPGTTSATLDAGAFTSGGQASTEGAHTLVVTATDAAVNTATVTTPFVVDLTNPTLALVTAAPPAWVRGTLTFQVIADDTLKAIGALTSDVVVTASGPGGAIATTPTFTTLADGRRRVDLSIDTTLVDDAAGTGSLTVRFDVTDRAGRTAPPLTIARSMDNAAPVIGFTGFPFGGATSGWSNAAAPALAIGGPLTDASPTTVTLAISVAAPVAVTVGAGTWTHTPASSLAEGSYVLTAVATDSAGNATTATYTLNIDRTGPAANNTPRAVYNETNDTITYDGANRPQHTHTGTQVMLGGATCQNIYKFVYLLATTPAGDESSPNPLAFDWRANDGAGVGVNTGSLTYAVTSPGGTTTAAFALPPTISGADVLATSTLHRDGGQAVPALGVVGVTEEGTFTIAFSVADRLGNATTVTRCWIHNPIGAPVQVTGSGAIAAGPIGVSLDALTEFKLAENDSLSPLFNGTHPGAGLMRIDLRNRTSDRVWFTFTPSISGATYTKTWNVKYQASSTAASTTSCRYDSISATILPPAAVCVNDGEYTGTLPGEVVSTPTAFTPTPTVRLFDMTVVANPVEVTVCPTCEPLEFELAPGIAYTAVVAIKHLQPLGFTGIASGYLEGNTGVAPGPIVPTTRLPITALTTTGNGVDRYCSMYTILTGTTARCDQTTTVGGVRWAAALGFGATVVTAAAASSAGSTLIYKRIGPTVMPANLVSASWTTTESPIP